MAIDLKQFSNKLVNRLAEFDVPAAIILCDNLVHFLQQSNEAVLLVEVEKVLQLLRSKRLFPAMLKVADTLLQTGRSSYKIQRQYAQALIDTGMYTAADLMLQNLITLTAQATDQLSQDENAEAQGLLGRVYKQLYVNANNRSNPQCVKYILSAVNAYYQVYATDYAKTWHGINAVALLERAKRDQVSIPSPVDSHRLANNILSYIQSRHNASLADAWDFATAAEACVALDQPEEALKWLSGYARMPYCDAFELASTLRQLEEVWQLDLESPMGQFLLPMLRSELVKRKGGDLTLTIKELNIQKAIESTIDGNYRSLMKQQSPSAPRVELDDQFAESLPQQKKKTTDPSLEPTEKPSEPNEVRLEKIFGEDSFKTYKWYMKGAARCLAVARIGSESSKGFGTGFLLRGKDLKNEWGEEIVLLTNAHVVSADPAEKALRPEEAIVIFEALNSNEEFSNLELIWTSPSEKLDASLLRFNAADQQRLKTLTSGVSMYPISSFLPAPEMPPTQKIYVIGHPYGGTLQISFQDNLLIDHDRVSKIHYRTPTAGGSSGSPVFNQQWELIGLHHAGSETMPCLNGKPGTYAANEGIWIQCIKQELSLST